MAVPGLGGREPSLLCDLHRQMKMPTIRREGDSNPRYRFCPYNDLANRRLKPLGHLSNKEKGKLAPDRAFVIRKERDSNPRTGFPVFGFQDRRLKPLGHPSKKT